MFPLDDELLLESEGDARELHQLVKRIDAFLLDSLKGCSRSDDDRFLTRDRLLDEILGDDLVPLGLSAGATKVGLSSWWRRKRSSPGLTNERKQRRGQRRRREAASKEALELTFSLSIYRRSERGGEGVSLFALRREGARRRAGGGGRADSRPRHSIHGRQEPAEGGKAWETFGDDGQSSACPW